MKTERRKATRTVCEKNHIDVQALMCWMRNPDRGEAWSEFTQGPTHNIAYAIERNFAKDENRGPQMLAGLMMFCIGVALGAATCFGLCYPKMHKVPPPTNQEMAAQLDQAKVAVLNGDLARAREVLGIEEVRG